MRTRRTPNVNLLTLRFEKKFPSAFRFAATRISRDQTPRDNVPHFETTACARLGRLPWFRAWSRESI
jgi:hypothetical protein